MPRIEINTSSLHGTISLLGGRIDDLTLANYRETLDPNSDEILLLIPKGDPKAYITQIGLYDGMGGDLLAIAKLSQPVLKSFSREAIIKVKLDF